MAVRVLSILTFATPFLFGDKLQALLISSQMAHCFCAAILLFYPFSCQGVASGKYISLNSEGLAMQYALWMPCDGGVESTTLTITNNCPYTIWPATSTGGGGAQLSNTGFQLDEGVSSSIDVPAQWTAGRVWARYQCTTDPTGKFTCPVADCRSGQVACNGAGPAPPATLAEFTLGSRGQDTYDVSNVDGFNLPLSVTPQGGAGDKCITTSCGVNINADCPQELAVKDANGGTIGCKSACAAFNKPEYCCTESFNTPETCPPTNYSMFFEQKCPQAYSYAYDDKSSTFVCTGPSPNYVITFCP